MAPTKNVAIDPELFEASARSAAEGKTADESPTRRRSGFMALRRLDKLALVNGCELGITEKTPLDC
jgi:hypothetical protein